MSFIRQTAEKLRGARHIEWVLMAALLSAAILLTSGGARSRAESTYLERRMETVLSCIEGAGKVRVLVNSSGSAAAFSDYAEHPAGILVVAEGAGDMRVKMELQRAVQALMDVEAEQIEILTMKEDD